MPSRLVGLVPSCAPPVASMAFYKLPPRGPLIGSVSNNLVSAIVERSRYTYRLALVGTSLALTAFGCGGNENGADTSVPAGQSSSGAMNGGGTNIASSGGELGLGGAGGAPSFGGAIPSTADGGGVFATSGAGGADSAGGAGSRGVEAGGSGGASGAGGSGGASGSAAGGSSGGSNCVASPTRTHNLHNDNWAGSLTLFISYSSDTRSQTVDKGYTAAEWNAAVDSFDVPSFAAQVANTGAKNIILMLGQNTGYYSSPNAAYEQYAGVAANTRCSRRDLPLEIADALSAKGVGMYLYLPEDVGWGDKNAASNFGLTTLAVSNWVVDAKFTPKWNAVIKTWAERYGSKVKGWFFDGYEIRWGVTQAMAQTYRDTCLAANPCGVVTFNGTGSDSVSDTQRGETRIDTTTGLPAKGLPTSRWDKNGLQVMWDFPLQAAWGQEIADNSPAIYTNANLKKFIAAGVKAQAVFALDCRTSLAGALSTPIYDQLLAIKQ